MRPAVTSPDGHAASLNGAAQRTHEDLRRLGREQAALRRVATLVAEGATQAELFAAVAREVGLVLNEPLVAVYRYEPDGTATVVGAIGDHPFEPGTNWPLDGRSVASQVRRTGRPAKVEQDADGARTLGAEAAFTSGVGAPIVVEGELWGVVAACSEGCEAPSPGAGQRLTEFTALVATAISNGQAREDLRRLADEQSALRRLATLVAEGAEPRLVFDAVCEETGRLVGARSVTLTEFTSDSGDVTMACWSGREAHVSAATPLPLEVAAPVVVEGRVWGALTAASDGSDPPPACTEGRLANFADLIATAVSSAAARSELVDSRVRIVEAADEQRRQVVRDLHDGAQASLIHAVMALESVPPGVRPLVAEGLAHARSAIDELRDLSHGIHPAALTRNGLAAAVAALAHRAPLTVEIEIPEERYPAPVESAAYFVAAEALTNVAKHARASTARIAASSTSTGLRLVVEDDGVGGATRSRGGGLAGLGDRLAALDGAVAIESPPGGGTRIRAEIPL
jgi:signal transduction histidine kinase